ncbi:hypothetical protein ACVJBD_003982 [Rhizobium mongolense]
MMTGATFNINATAIVVNKTGLLFVGPSGWGKSMLAFTCITEAKRMGLPASLVADDQVFLSKRDGQMIAERPSAISGLIELRGTGIVKCESVPLAPMHYAVLPGSPSGENRLPPDNDVAQFAEGFSLPALRLLPNAPVPLAILMAKAPDIGR